MDTLALDQAVEDLEKHKRDWAAMPIRDKIGYLDDIVETTDRVAERWVASAARAKRIPASSPLIGEEWISGPWALIAGAVGFAATLEALAAGTDPLRGVGVRTRADGQVVLDVFPATVFDRILLSAYSAEVWMQPGIVPGDVTDHVGRFYRHPGHDGRVDLVLGAGNVASIVPLDLLYKMFVEGAVVVVKLNPVNDYLGDYFETIFAPLIDDGFIRVVRGDGQVGAYLVDHPGVEGVHITGSARTHDAIVFGVGDEGAERKQHHDPRLDKAITSELGGVGATIVVPGPWSAGDLQYQAQNLATMKLHNGGFNCIAMQTLVLPETWVESDRLVAALRQAIMATEPRYPYYPGADDRRRLMADAHPEAELIGGLDSPMTLIRDVDPTQIDDVCFTTEAFGSVLATTKLTGEDPEAFLDQAVLFCNDILDGTLGVNILVHPTTLKMLGDRFDRALGDLRYGTIGVNCWNAVSYLLQRTPWGAYPGHTLDDIQSGIGVVHNTLMLSDTQKTIVRGPFRTFPRSILHGDLHLATKPPWYISHRRADIVGRRLTHFAARPRWRDLPALFPPALSG